MPPLGDVLAGPAAWVTRAIEVLVVRQGDVAGHAQELGTRVLAQGGGQSTCPDDRVPLHQAESRIDGAARQANLMDGVALAMGGTARRMLADAAPPAADVLQAIRNRRTLEALAEAPGGRLASALHER